MPAFEGNGPVIGVERDLAEDLRSPATKRD